MKTRRVVTENIADGSSDFASDGAAPRAVSFVTVPGFEACMLWAEDGNRSEQKAAADTTRFAAWVPEASGSRLLKVIFPPDSVFASAEFDPTAAGQEYIAKLPGLAETFEPDAPGMHRTDSIDYAVVLQGEIWLELDQGREKHLTQHDVVVQTGTRHAWRNRGSQSVTMLFVLLGR